MSKLPFASVDPDPAFLLERKQGLEKYLQVSHYSIKLDPLFLPTTFTYSFITAKIWGGGRGGERGLEPPPQQLWYTSL